jgi:hypothetical protein
MKLGINMKRFAILILVVFITGCNFNAKQPINEVTIDTGKNDTVPVVSQNSANSFIKINKYYFNTRRGEIQPSRFLFFLNDRNCIHLGEECTYEFEEENRVLIVNTEAGERVIYKLFSGAKARDIFDKIGADIDMLNSIYGLSNNFDNQSYAFFKMIEDAPNHIDVDYGFSNIFLFKDLEQGNGEFMNQLNLDLTSKISQLQKSIERFQTGILVLENKIDVVKDLGKTSVNEALNNKVDYTYEGLIMKWDIITSEIDRLEKKVNSYKGNYTTADMRTPKIYQRIREDDSAIMVLSSEKVELEKILDGEILPLLH